MPPTRNIEPRAYRPPRRLLVVVWVGLVLSWRTPAAAEPTAAEPHTHQAGPPLAPTIASHQPPESGHYLYDSIYVRLYAGPAYFMGREAFTSNPNTGSEQRRHRTQFGLGVGYGALLGTPVARNLVLYGEIVGATVSDPTVTNNYDGVLITDYVHQFAFGLGAAYILEPRNLYVSGTLTFPKDWFDYSNQSQFPTGTRDKTNLGVGINLMVGREWWISRTWAIGMAAQVHLATMGYPTRSDDFNPDMRLYSGTFALLFSAACN